MSGTEYLTYFVCFVGRPGGELVCGAPRYDARMPSILGILETAISAQDVDRSETFYCELFGFTVMAGDERFRALAVAPAQVLLIFREGGSLLPMPTPGGVIPPHDGRGPMHLAFSIAREELEPWRQKLQAAGVPLESEVRWPTGGASLYFRDPDQHLVELATPGIWPVY